MGLTLLWEGRQSSADWGREEMEEVTPDLHRRMKTGETPWNQELDQISGDGPCGEDPEEIHEVKRQSDGDRRREEPRKESTRQTTKEDRKESTRQNTKEKKE